MSSGRVSSPFVDDIHSGRNSFSRSFPKCPSHNVPSSMASADISMSPRREIYPSRNWSFRT